MGNKKQDIKKTLSEATDGALDENVLNQIEEAFEDRVKDRVQIHVEKALNEQDELYTKKLKQVIEAIDTDHSKKLKNVVEAIDKDRTAKLKLVVSRYEKAINEDAKLFKGDLVESISEFIDVYIENKIPSADIQEAVKNKKAAKILEGLRHHLAVDSALEKEAIKEAVKDGQKQISEASNELESVRKKNAQILKENDDLKKRLFLEERVAKLDERAKTYVKKAFADKDYNFITENFDYTVKLFKKKEVDRLEELKTEAFSTKEKVDRVITEKKQPAKQELVSENTVPASYLSELSKY
jgi:hypothetical protein